MELFDAFQRFPGREELHADHIEQILAFFAVQQGRVRQQGLGLARDPFKCLPQGWVHALPQAHQIDRTLKELLQLLLQVHRGVGSEGIQFDPHIHIA
ncbi:MAG: hypothetical protein VKI81_06485, partial [Synechococcaceae cyanobacterium]|nr:hypothetical protein [Synechococcaceae cyanobacterium]